ncbi:hypothetical protein [Kangiella sp. M94]
MKTIRNLLIISMVITLSACATRLTKPEGPAEAPETAFRAYERVILAPITISPDFAEHSSNQSARDKMDNYLKQLMASTFKDVEFEMVGDASKVVPNGKRTLVIQPHIKEIKFVNTAARIFAGAIAGGSAVLMEVSMDDINANKSIGNPEFYADASAWSGWGADNKVLNRVIEDINFYFRTNY